MEKNTWKKLLVSTAALSVVAEEQLLLLTLTQLMLLQKQLSNFGSQQIQKRLIKQLLKNSRRKTKALL